MKALPCTFQYFQDIPQAFRQIATSLVVLLADWTCDASIHIDRRRRRRIVPRSWRGLPSPFRQGDMAWRCRWVFAGPDKALKYSKEKKAQGLNDASRFNALIFQNSYSQNGRGMPIVRSLWLLPAVAYVIFTGHSCCCSLRRPQVRILETRGLFGTFQGNGERCKIRDTVDSSILGLKNDLKICSMRVSVDCRFLLDEIDVHIKGSWNSGFLVVILFLRRWNSCGNDEPSSENIMSWEWAGQTHGIHSITGLSSWLWEKEKSDAV